MIEQETFQSQNDSDTKYEIGAIPRHFSRMEKNERERFISAFSKIYTGGNSSCFRFHSSVSVSESRLINSQLRHCNAVPLYFIYILKEYCVWKKCEMKYAGSVRDREI